MKVAVYAILDEKAMCFGQPFCLSTNGQAIRAFGDSVKTPDSQHNKHPGDYKLYQLATYDDEAGTFVCCQQPVFLAHGIEFVTSPTAS